MSDAELAELDRAIAKIEGRTWSETLSYRPTRDCAEAMRLLERHRLSLRCRDFGGLVYWQALDRAERDLSRSHCATPMEAICRAVIALKGSPKP